MLSTEIKIMFLKQEADQSGRNKDFYPNLIEVLTNKTREKECCMNKKDFFFLQKQWSIMETKQFWSFFFF